MSEIDKMARELLAQWHLQKGLSEKVADDCRKGAIDIPDIYWDLIRAALLTAPPGWKLVPVESTRPMLGAFLNATQGGYRNYESGYLAMLAAAPEPK